ncbi:MAG: MBL fold metallo-hydrolase, partial [Deltaproteobacteria bacterium]|nr:MBL fold metallo-hydrolase [Deltaproteobacteria bacterium]
AGLNHEDIRRVFITHFHPDHTAGLIHFLFTTKNPSILKKRDPFVIAGALGLKEFINRLQGAYSDWLSLPPEIIKIEELDGHEKIIRDYPGFRIIAQPVRHTPESLAYRVEDQQGKSFVYSGDTGFCEELIDLSKGTDLLILESSFPDGEKVEGHLTPSQAGSIATSANVNRLVLIHFYPECLTTDITAQCRKTYGGEITLGSDLLHLYI